MADSAALVKALCSASVQLPQRAELQWDGQQWLPWGSILTAGSAAGRLSECCCPTAVPAEGEDVCRDWEGVLMSPARVSLHWNGSHPPRLVPAMPSQGLFWVWSKNQRPLKGLSHICLINLDCYLWIFSPIKTNIQYKFFLFVFFWVSGSFFTPPALRVLTQDGFLSLEVSTPSPWCSLLCKSCEY